MVRRAALASIVFVRAARVSWEPHRSQLLDFLEVQFAISPAFGGQLLLEWGLGDWVVLEAIDDIEAFRESKLAE